MSSIYIGPLNPASAADAGYLPDALNFTGWTYTSNANGGYLSRPGGNPATADRLLFTLNSTGRVMGFEYVAYDVAAAAYQTAFRALLNEFPTIDNILSRQAEIGTLISGGADTVWGNDFSTAIYSGNGADFIRAGDGNDTVFGGEDYDQLLGQGGADALDGGAGIDTANFTTSNAAVTVNLATGRGTGGDAEGDTYVAIENIAGGNGDDVLIGNNVANRIDGGSGFDVIYGLGGDDILNGNSGAALFNTNAGGNTMFGGDGNDLIDGGNGRTTLFGEAGDDTLTAGGLADYVDGGAGWDLVNYSGIFTPVTVNLATGLGTGGAADGDVYVSIEAVATHTADDVVIGSNEGNYVWSGAGNDQVFGLAGNDRLEGFHGDDALFGGDGDDIIGGSLGNDGVFGEAGNDVLYGSEGNDYLSGGTGNDVLWGGLDQDFVEAGDGDDFIGMDGGDGNDTYVLGSGNDVVQFRYGNGTDIITDFGIGQDVIDFSATDMTLAVLQANASNTSEGLLLGIGSGSILLAGVGETEIDWSADFSFAAQQAVG